MKITKNIVKVEIIEFFRKRGFKKINFLDNKLDLIKDEIMDSIDFLNLISALENKFKIKIDLSMVNPKVLSKISKLSAMILNNSKKK